MSTELTAAQTYAERCRSVSLSIQPPVTLARFTLERLPTTI